MLHLNSPSEMLYGLTNLLWSQVEMSHIVDNLLNINGGFISRSLDNIGLMIEIRILF